MKSITKNYLGLQRKKSGRISPPSGLAYRTGGSTNNLILTPRFIATKYQISQEHKIFIIGIDLSSAFKTSTHQSLLHKMAASHRSKSNDRSENLKNS